MARVDFPLHCCFELHCRKPTITAVQVRETHPDGRTAANTFDSLSTVTNVNCKQKRKSPLASCAERVFSGKTRTDREKCSRRELRCARTHTYQSIACWARRLWTTVECVDSSEHGSSMPFGTSSRLVAVTNYLSPAREAWRISEWKRDEKESRRSQEEKESWVRRDWQARRPAFALVNYHSSWR